MRFENDSVILWEEPWEWGNTFEYDGFVGFVYSTEGTASVEESDGLDSIIDYANYKMSGRWNKKVVFYKDNEVEFGFNPKYNGIYIIDDDGVYSTYNNKRKRDYVLYFIEKHIEPRLNKLINEKK